MKWFGRKDPAPPKWDHAKSEFESSIRSVSELGVVTLSLAGMDYWTGFNVRVWRDRGDNTLSKSPAYKKLVGVVHTSWERVVRFSLDVDANPVSEDAIGVCRLTLDGKADRPEDRDLILIGGIGDPDGNIWASCETWLRDAAMSGDQFVHIAVSTKALESNKEIFEIRRVGYGSDMPIVDVRRRHRLRLPNAPRWAFEPKD